MADIRWPISDIRYPMPEADLKIESAAEDFIDELSMRRSTGVWWVSRCPRDRALRLQFKARILRDREQPGRFEVLLGSLTTTRPIVPQNYSPARIRFILAACINPIFCYQSYLRDRYGRLAFRC